MEDLFRNWQEKFALSERRKLEEAENLKVRSPTLSSQATFTFTRYIKNAGDSASFTTGSPNILSRALYHRKPIVMINDDDTFVEDSNIFDDDYLMMM